MLLEVLMSALSFLNTRITKIIVKPNIYRLTLFFVIYKNKTPKCISILGCTSKRFDVFIKYNISLGIH